LAHGRSERVVLEFLDLDTRDGAGAGLGHIEFLGDPRGGARMVARDHQDADAGARASPIATFASARAGR
jgi:hypothetical protein